MNSPGVTKESFINKKIILLFFIALAFFRMDSYLPLIPKIKFNIFIIKEIEMLIDLCKM